MRSILTRSLCACLAVVAMSAPAAAAPVTIGDFFYDTDPFFGPMFSVSNFSDATLDEAGTFTSLTLSLFAGSDLVLSTELGPLAAGGSVDTLAQDLSLFAFDTATLVAVFSLPGDVAVDALAGITFEGSFPFFLGTEHLDSFIRFSPPMDVPEPSTLLHFAGAAVALAIVTRTARRRG